MTPIILGQKIEVSYTKEIGILRSPASELVKSENEFLQAYGLFIVH